VNDDLQRLEDELAGVAREIATVLTTQPLDGAALAALDRRAGELREQVKAARPSRALPDLVLHCGSRLMLSGG
jgi:hypothetical protein